MTNYVQCSLLKCLAAGSCRLEYVLKLRHTGFISYLHVGSINKMNRINCKASKRLTLNITIDTQHNSRCAMLSACNASRVTIPETIPWSLESLLMTISILISKKHNPAAIPHFREGTFKTLFSETTHNFDHPRFGKSHSFCFISSTHFLWPRRWRYRICI